MRSLIKYALALAAGVGVHAVSDAAFGISINTLQTILAMASLVAVAGVFAAFDGLDP